MVSKDLAASAIFSTRSSVAQPDRHRTVVPISSFRSMFHSATLRLAFRVNSNSTAWNVVSAVNAVRAVGVVHVGELLLTV